MTRGGRVTVKKPNEYIPNSIELDVRPAIPTVTERLINPDKEKQQIIQSGPLEKPVTEVPHQVEGPKLSHDMSLKRLHELYFDPRYGFLGLDKLMKLAKENKIDLKQKEVKAWLEKQRTWQLTKQQHLPSEYTSYWAAYPGKEFQIDLMVYNRFKQDNYQYILCMIDIYSRYAMAVPLTRKLQGKNEEDMEAITPEERVHTYVDAIKKMCADAKMWPESISGDQEFNKTSIMDLFRQHNPFKNKNYHPDIKNQEAREVKFFFSSPIEIHKNPVVERFHRTLATRLQKWRESFPESKLEDKIDPKRWYKALPDILEGYNNSYHSTVRAKPADLFFGKDVSKQVINVVPPSTKFNLGDKVRILNKRKNLQKGDTNRYSKEVYSVVGFEEGKIKIREFSDKTMDFKGTPFLKKPYELIFATTLETPEQKAAAKEVPERQKGPTRKDERVLEEADWTGQMSKDKIIKERTRAAEAKAKEAESKKHRRGLRVESKEVRFEGDLSRANEKEAASKDHVGRLTRSKSKR
jgi:hypothetical protein